MARRRPRSLITRFKALSSTSRVVGTVFFVIALFFLGFLARRFYVQHTYLAPATGGTYIEGSVGFFQPVIPWFLSSSDVNKDIASLIFAGLLRYNPETTLIEGDVADVEVSVDGRTYTAILKNGITWHDHTEEQPRPVTADDVVFTFKTIQDEAFPNQLLQQNFNGVEIEKINDTTVTFVLDEPYSFFLSNLTLGLLPEHLLADVPVAYLDQAYDFGERPVGCGPFKFESISYSELSTEVSLKKFQSTASTIYNFDEVVFRIFPDYLTLLSDLRNLNGVRLVPSNEDGQPIIPKRFTPLYYSLPQYVALFFNLDSPILKDVSLRLGLQLGTNKEDIIKIVSNDGSEGALNAGVPKIIDTPLLEINNDDWQYLYDPVAAQGALFESDWNFPEKIRMQELWEQSDVNTTGVLRAPYASFLPDGAVLILTGSLADVTLPATINGSLLEVNTNNTEEWIVAISTLGERKLAPGINVLKLTELAVESEDEEIARAKDVIIDSFIHYRATEQEEYDSVMAEQELVSRFIDTVNPDVLIAESKQLTSADVILEKGYLRERTAQDPVDIRVNDEGERLTLTLLTSSTPEIYPIIAERIADAWQELGVHVSVIVPENIADFEDKVVKRDYDLVLYGQSLLDNLDSYPYWHSSGIQLSKDGQTDLRIDAYNLSQYKNKEADKLLEHIRRTNREDERNDALDRLRTQLKEDVPAIFLYSPLYTFAYNEDLQGVRIGRPSLHSDRFFSMQYWFKENTRRFKDNVSWADFPGWIFGF